MSAATIRNSPPPPPVGGFEDYLPADLADFAGLITDDEPDQVSRKKSNDSKTADALGIDTEVDVKKTARTPRVKLDESRLLSAKGIPSLRQRAGKLKIKGKGHEFSDAARLLSMYQLWLDELFPKARFADALVMVEKEGHKASMHKMRTDWINEAKPRTRLSEDEGDAGGPSDLVDTPQGPAAHIPGAATGAGHGTASIPIRTNVEFDDAFDEAPPAFAGVADDLPNDDELDALMAEAMEVHELAPQASHLAEPAAIIPPAQHLTLQQTQPSQATLHLAQTDDSMSDLDALVAEAEEATLAKHRAV